MQMLEQVSRAAAVSDRIATDFRKVPLPEPIVRVDRLTIAAADGRAVVRGVSFNVYPGHTVGIVGGSGSGKSLTCRAILGLLPEGLRVTSGTVSVLGQDLRALKDRDLRRLRGRQIGAVFQDPGSYLNPSMRIGDQIAECVRLHQGGSRREARERALELLDAVRMSSARDVYRRFPFELSGGMQQRALIAIALSGDPSLLIADEVTTALDVIVQDQIVKLLQEHKERRRLAMVMVSHDLSLVSQVCDYLVVMTDGAIVEQGPRAEILRNPAEAYTRRLISNHSKFGLNL
jgi:ABC-type glutathione transport system ATPase component